MWFLSPKWHMIVTAIDLIVSIIVFPLALSYGGYFLGTFIACFCLLGVLNMTPSKGEKWNEQEWIG